MRVRISQIKVALNHSEQDVVRKACKKIRIQESVLMGYEIVKKSIDARKKEQLQYIYSVDLILNGQQKLKIKDKDVTILEKVSYLHPTAGNLPLIKRPVVIGAGPAGLFCAYLLALHGYRPLVLERGKQIEDRRADVETFWNTGMLNKESNVQFGEGGAGTFSDGKLNTVVKDKFGRNRYVLETFVALGAPEDILYSNKPHIGTDVLFHVIRAMRHQIIELGGSFSFSSCVTDVQIVNNYLAGITINETEKIDCDVAVLATGHSARDTFKLLYDKDVSMEAKPFAVGFRVEHPQQMINENQYHTTDMHYLPTADYKVSYHSGNGRAVYSFCMCPGGHVVNASSEDEMLAVNGMSYRARDGKNANSAIIVSVTPSDYPSDHPLAGIEFQRHLEKNAYSLGQGKIPQQLFKDFEHNTTSTSYGTYESAAKGKTVFANLRTVLPECLNDSFCEGMHYFGQKIKGFDRPDVILSAVESRTSSPVRILRDEFLESNIRGLYPCGEGAGYAGGITSAAMDGLKAAEEIIKKYKPEWKVQNQWLNLHQ